MLLLPSTAPPPPAAAQRRSRGRYSARCPRCHAAAGEASATAEVWSSHALKEWASVCSSLAAGESTLLLRKGGIAEKGFKLAAPRFALLGTVFHDADASLKQSAAEAHGGAVGVIPGSDASLELLAEVTGAWVTSDAEGAATLLSACHPWRPERLLSSRLAWQPGQKLTLVELRVYRAPTPYALRGEKEHAGCKSWVALPEPLRVARGELAPALDDAAWAERQRALREALRALKDCDEIVM